MDGNNFSPSSIAKLRSTASNLSTRHRRYSDSLAVEIEMIDRLLVSHLSGVPDAQIELITVGRRLQTLVEMEGRHVIG